MAFDIVIGPDAQPATFDIVIGDSDAPPVLASGTTLAALEAGSAAIKFVAAIEGYPYLLTDATPQQAIDAWYAHTGTHYYTQALDGLLIELENQQRLDPNAPFGRGGRCLLSVVGESENGTFAVDTHKTNAGAETKLTATIDRDDATLAVASTTNFPASGELWCGTECIGYTAATPTTFPNAVRGKYVPFANGGDGIGFAAHHRVGRNSLDVQLPTRVTAHPREWVGRWVGVWAHKIAGGALNSRTDALCVYAGRIVSVRDSESGATQIELKHVLDCIVEATVGGRDIWRAEIVDRVKLVEGNTFRVREVIRAVLGGIDGDNTSDDLEVVAKGTAVGANMIDEGTYAIAEVLGFLNAWLASELAAGRIDGTYSVDLVPAEDEVRARISWTVGGTGTADVSLGMPQGIRTKLGYDEDYSDGTVQFVSSGVQMRGEQHAILADDAYVRSLFAVGSSGSLLSETVVHDEDGTFRDQYAYIPASDRPASDGGHEWGVFLIDERILVIGWRDTSGTETLIRDMDILSLLGQSPDPYWYRFPVGPSQPETTRIRQVFRLEMTRGEALKRFLLSTGAPGYNDATYDDLPYGLGLGIPAELAGPNFAASIDALPGSDLPIVVSIDQTIALRELFGADLNLVRGFLRWRQGGLEFGTWQTPHPVLAVAELAEDNKAAPAGTEDHHRAVTVRDATWARPIVTIKYNRDFNSSSNGRDGYRDTLTIIDGPALDNAGGEGAALELAARNTYSDFALTGAGVETLAPGYMATMPLFSRPSNIITRSLTLAEAEAIAVGDVVTLTDRHARDPDTGLRGVIARPAFVLGHRYTWGGITAPDGQTSPMGGEAALFVLEQNRLAEYGPCADVDDTAGNAGYDQNGTGPNGFAFTCYAHHYSEANEDADASHFEPGDLIRVIEKDPADPANPVYWDDEVFAVDGNRIDTVGTEFGDWSGTKRWRVVHRNYADVTTSQRAHAFQADDADAMIADLRVPFEFGVGNAAQVYTHWGLADEVELPPTMSYGDGVSHDTGYDTALARLANNLINVKTNRQNPTLSNTVMSGAALGAGATWRLVRIEPIYLSLEQLSNDYYRRLTVAPWFRSSDGSSASVRVSLSRTYPNANTLDDVGLHVDTSSQTWTTTSVAWATGADQTLVCNVKGLDGIAWLIIECSTTAETRGIAKLVESERLYPP